MALPKRSSPTQTQDQKHRVLSCLNKLSDRDTHAIAATELDTIARTLTPTTIPSFLTCLSNTDSSEKTPVRKQCVHLLSLLSQTHGNNLSPFLPKMLSHILLRRLKDSDSSVRSACIDAVTVMSTHITKPSFSLFLKPLSETLLFEQDYNSQIGSALCLSSAIDAAHDPEPVQLQKLLPKLVKLLRSESFKAKPALLSLVGSVLVGSGASISKSGLGSLISCMTDFLSSEDWAARKAAAEAFVKLAFVERDQLPEFKSTCLASFETRRFDKVKVVRDTMNQMMEAWKNVPDVLQSQQSQSCSTDNGNDGRFPPRPVNSNTMSYESSQSSKSTILTSRSSSPSDSSSATTERKRSPPKGRSKRATPPVFHKLDRKKEPTDWNVDISVPGVSTGTVNCEDDFENRDKSHLELGESGRDRRPKHEKKDTFFPNDIDEKMHKLGVSRPESIVVPFDEESSESTVTSNDEMELYGDLKESEDLLLIQKKLIQIEDQQSSLLNLLQRFMGSSQNGIRSLETRVNDLEMALDEISYDLAVSTRKTPISGSAENTYKPPLADFLSSKFRREPEGQYSSSKLSLWEDRPALSSTHHIGGRYGNTLPYNLENRRAVQHGGGNGFIVNPSTDMYYDSRQSRRCD